MRTCKFCKIKFKPKYNSVQETCDFECAIELGKLRKEKKVKSIQRNKRSTHSHLFIKENKADLQKTINHIARLIDKGIRCIDCERTRANPCWDGGHRESRGSNPTLRYNLHNIFKQTRYCNSKSEGNKIDYNEGIIKMYGDAYFDKVDSLRLRYKTINLLHSEIPIALKEARKVLREIKKLDLEYTATQRIKLREKYNKRIGIYL